MSENLETCVEPHLAAFEQTYAAENYTARTIVTYRCLTRKFGALLDEAGIAPSSVTPGCVEPLTRNVTRVRKNTIRLDTIARRFVQHLVDIGVAQPVPLTETDIARAALLADFETYLVKQRGLSPRSIPHSVGFARRFLDYRFGEALPDLGRLCPADVIGFMEHVLASARRDKTVATHVRIFFQYLFGRGATATNLALSVPTTAKRWAARLPRRNGGYTGGAVRCSSAATAPPGIPEIRSRTNLPLRSGSAGIGSRRWMPTAVRRPRPTESWCRGSWPNALRPSARTG